MASTYLTRTFQSGGNTAKWTFSAWIKKCAITNNDDTIFSRYQSADYYTTVAFGSDRLFFTQRHAGSNVGYLETEQHFRDTNGWYHFVIVWDSGNSTANNRMRIYVNGSEITVFNTRTNPSQDLGSTWNTAHPMEIGRHNSGNYFNGFMSHIHFCDGYAYSPSDFGETDSNGVWRIKTSPSVSYGTTGFTILKDGNSVTDQSGNSNNWTVSGGTLTDDKDNPSNVFATLNPLANTSQTLSHGNTSGYGVVNKAYTATLGFQGGKYYWEAKCVTQNTYTMIVGITNETNLQNGSFTSSNIGTNANGWAYFMQSNQDNGKSFHNNSLGSVYQTVSQGGILQIAVDADAGKIWWGVNGTWVNSGNPATGANAVYTNVSTDQILFPAYSAYDGSGGNPLISFNFGNGRFGTTAVSSAGTNASGNGVFEYDVPTGYTALCTKGLNGE